MGHEACVLVVSQSMMRFVEDEYVEVLELDVGVDDGVEGNASCADNNGYIVLR